MYVHVTILVSVNIMVVDNNWMKEVDICRSCQSTFPTFQQTIAPGGGQGGQNTANVHPNLALEKDLLSFLVLVKCFTLPHLLKVLFLVILFYSKLQTILSQKDDLQQNGKYM